MNAVFAEIALACCYRLVDCFDTECFRYRNERHVGGLPAGTLRCCSDPAADDREVFGDGHRGDYFLICERMPYACSAY